jgi:replicative DNA helicase Mcm
MKEPKNKVYSNAEIQRLLSTKLSNQQVQNLLDYLDPKLKLEKLLEDLDTQTESENNNKDNWYIIKSKYVLINIKRLKEMHVKYFHLFESNTTNWIYCFKLQWYQRKRKVPLVRFVNKIDFKTDKICAFKDLSHRVNKYVIIKGSLRRLSSVTTAITGSLYQCRACLQKIQKDRLWFEKLKNAHCTCGSKEDLIDLQCERTYETWQTLTIQGDISDSNIEQESLGGFNTMDLVQTRLLYPEKFNHFNPGENIVLTGIVKMEVTEKAKSNLYIDVLTVKNLEEKTKNPQLSQIHLQKVKELSCREDLWSHLKQTLFHDIFGVSELKDAALLQLFSSSHRQENENSRNSLHVLVVGDAGTGKSKMLKKLHQMFGGLYTTGLGATTAGLTASVYKDKDNSWSIDSGALVVANKSTLYIDELDKLPLSICNSLLEPMEQQTVSISKAGINMVLPAQTKVFAAANPKFKSYFDNDAPPISQIELPKTILSRFDLIVILTEQNQKDYQKAMVKGLLQRKPSKKQILKNVIDYILYARSLKKPQIKQNIRDKIAEFYTFIRNSVKKKYNELIVGPRQLESLVRIAEAKARSRLASEVSQEDFNFAHTYYRKLLEQQYNTNFDDIETETVQDFLSTNFTKKQMKITELIKKVLKQNTALTPDFCFLKVINYDSLCTKNIFRKCFKALEDSGAIYKPDGLRYKLTCNYLM